MTLVVATALACATPTGTDRTRLEGTLLGCALGLGAGALLGSAETAAAGFAAGCLAGLGLGHTVAVRQERYAEREAGLDRELASLRVTNERLRSYNVTLVAELANVQKELRVAQSRIARQRRQVAIARADLRALRRVVDRDRLEVQALMVIADRSLAAARTRGAPQSVVNEMLDFRAQLTTAHNMLGKLRHRLEAL